MFKPVNRHILIENRAPKNEKETPAGILLPENFKPTEERYICSKVIDWAEDIRFKLTYDSKIIVDSSMIEEITVNNLTYSIIQDNYIIGII